MGSRQPGHHTCAARLEQLGARGAPPEPRLCALPVPVPATGRPPELRHEHLHHHRRRRRHHRPRHRVPLRRWSMAGGGSPRRSGVRTVVGRAHRRHLRPTVRRRLARLQQPLDPVRFHRVHLPRRIRWRPQRARRHREPEHGRRRLHHRPRLRAAVVDASPRRTLWRRPGTVERRVGTDACRSDRRRVRRVGRRVGLRMGWWIDRASGRLTDRAHTVRSPGSTSTAATAPISWSKPTARPVPLWPTSCSARWPTPSPAVVQARRQPRRPTVPDGSAALRQLLRRSWCSPTPATTASKRWRSSTEPSRRTSRSRTTSN